MTNDRCLTRQCASLLHSAPARTSNRLLAKSVSFFALALLALFAHVAHATDALNFFNNWFITGDYAVAGIGLANTGGVGAINMTGVPCTNGVKGPMAAIVPCTTAGAVPATPIAAFLYWQTVESTQAPAAMNGTFNGFPIAGTLRGSDSSSHCWASQNQAQTLRVYRADVLRFLPVDPTTHIRLGNAKHTVTLGQGVSGNNGVLTTEGASLVVIYCIFVPESH